MQGTIISVKGRDVTYEFEGRLFTETVNPELADKAHPGALAECETSPITGKTELKKVKSRDYRKLGVALSPSLEVEDHKIVSYQESPILAAEGWDFDETLKALVDKAKEYQVNGLLDFKVNCVSRFLGRGCRYALSALPATVDGPKFAAKPGLKAVVPENLARVNSPNKAMLRYVRVLLSCLLIIGIPCLLRLGDRGVIGAELSKSLCGFLIAVCFYFGAMYFPCACKAFLLRGNKRHVI